VYGNQLRRSQKLSELKDVYAVNLMECPFSTIFDDFEPGEYRRHYKMTDLSMIGTPRSLKHLNLIQFSLHALDLDMVNDAEERWWLDFFKNADKYDAIPKGCPPAVAAAYEKVRTDALPPAMRNALDVEDGRYVNFEGLIKLERKESFDQGFAQGMQDFEQVGKQEGKQETLRRLLRDGTISQAAYDSALQDVDSET
jgi:hypothetical protein